MPGAMDQPSPAPPPRIVTPCTKVCFIDDASGLCLGCFRTIEEVARWSGYSDARRAEIMTELPGRKGQIDPAKLGLT